MRSSYYQREWLLEDVEQIRRYFPDAELLKAINTPFDIQVESPRRPLRSGDASEKRAGECGLPASKARPAPEERLASLATMSGVAVLLLRGNL